MAKQFDLSGLKKQPVKKANKPKVDDVVKAIHKEEESSYKEEEVKKVTPKNKEKKVSDRVEEDKEVLKRVTLDLPASLHTKLKLRAVHDETTIRNFVIELLEDALD
jgi:predicted HicB family RNase H-like nuclease